MALVTLLAGSLLLGMTGVAQAAEECPPPSEAAAPCVTLEAASAITETTATLKGIVNPHTSEAVKYEFEYAESPISTGEDIEDAPVNEDGADDGEVAAGAPKPVKVSIEELKPGTTYYYRITGWNESEAEPKSSRELTFKTGGKPPPAVTIEDTTGVTATSATLHATVHPNGSETHYHFEYGTTEAYGSTTSEGDAGSGTAGVPVSATLTGLQEGTQYYYRIVVWSSTGASEESSTFATLRGPLVVTEPETGVTKTSATLQASVNPSGLETHYYFQYGETPAYGSKTPEGDAGSGNTSVHESATITGLHPGKTYYYRFVAWNSAGTSESTGGNKFIPEGTEPTSSSIVLSSGEMIVFSRNTADDLIAYARSPSGVWSVWNLTSLANGNPHIVGTPNPIVAPNGELLVFADDTTGELISFARETGGGWHAWDITGLANGNPHMVGSPSPIVAPNGELLVFADGTTGELISFARTTGGGWRAWDITGLSNGNPHIAWNPSAIVAPNGELLVFADGTTGELISFAREAGGGWHAWDITGLSNGNPHIAGTPSPIDTKAGELLVFADGTTGELISFAREAGGGWHAWDITGLANGNPHMSDVPDPIETPAGELLVFAAGTTGELISFARETGGGWKAWNITGLTNGHPHMTDTPSSIISPSGEPMVVVSGVDGELLQFDREVGGGWSDWSMATLFGDIIFTTLPESPGNTALPAVSPTTPHQGVAEAATTGSWTNSPTSYTYQWERCNASGVECVNISGATSSGYTPVAADVEHTLVVDVTATNSGGSGSAASSPTGKVVIEPPVNTALPAVSPTTPVQGSPETTTTGSWTNSPTAYVYQWERCNASGAECANISGATSSSYTPVEADVGHTLVAKVTATNGGGSNSAISAETGKVVQSQSYTQTVDSPNSLNAVSCIPASTDCVASDSKGQVFYATKVSATSSATWTAWKGPVESASQAVDCPTSSLCLLADKGNMYYATSLGGAWTEAYSPSYGVDAISCPSSSFCVDGQNADGYFRYATNPASTSWTTEDQGSASMNGVSCISSSFCAIVSSAGDVYVADTTSQIESSSWTATDVDGSSALHGVACASTTSCLAVDGAGNVLKLAISEGKATATKQDIDGSSDLTAITCSGSSTCVAVDSTGNIFITTNGGTSWTKEYTTGTDLTSVSCASTSLCAAVDTTGKVTSFKP